MPLLPPPTPHPRWTSVRVVWVYRGQPTGLWQSEQVQWGLSVIPYARAEVPPTTAGQIFTGVTNVTGSGLRAETTNWRATYGWTDATDPDHGLAGYVNQAHLITTSMELAHAIRTRLGNRYYLERMELRPQTHYEPCPFPATIATPNGTYGQPTGSGNQPPRLAISVRCDTKRRGRHGRGVSYVGPPASTIGTPEGLILDASRLLLANSFATWARTLRTPPNPLQPVAWCPVVWQKQSPLAAPIHAFRVSDELASLRSRQTHRAALHTTSVV